MEHHHQHHHHPQYHHQTIEDIMHLMQDVNIDDDQKKEILRITKNHIDIAKESHKVVPTIHETAGTLETKIKRNGCAIPDGILVTDFSAKLTDFVVSRNDDSIFKDKRIWRYVTRGLSIMELTCEDEGEKSDDVVIYANRKFFGIEEETKDSSVPSLARPTQKIFCMEKLDGDAAHFTFRWIDGICCVIGGSKNVHMIFKDYEDIEKYKDRRFVDAKAIAKSVLRTLNKMEAKKLDILKRFLNATKLTVVCELLQANNQHIVNIPALKEIEEEEDGILYFLMFCQTATINETDSLTAFPPQLEITLAEAFGFLTPNFFIFDGKDVKSRITQIRQEYNIEGYVFYHLNEENKTIKMEKVKTMWNTMLVTVRENLKFSKKKQIPVEDKMANLRTKFEKLQIKYKFTDKYRESWEMLAEEFLKYLDNNIKSLTVDDVNKSFPVTWNGFLSKFGKIDEFPYIETAE